MLLLGLPLNRVPGSDSEAWSEARDKLQTARGILLPLITHSRPVGALGHVTGLFKPQCVSFRCKLH